jgi:hypothetical protein
MYGGGGGGAIQNFSSRWGIGADEVGGTGTNGPTTGGSGIANTGGGGGGGGHPPDGPGGPGGSGVLIIQAMINQPV